MSLHLKALVSQTCGLLAFSSCLIFVTGTSCWAASPPVYIKFDDGGMGNGMRISDEYASEGVHFVSDYVSSGVFRSAPTIQATSAAWSAPNILVNKSTDSEIFTSGNVPLVIRFDKAIAGVGMRLGCSGGNCINVPTATIRLYDCTGTLRATKTVTVKPDFTEGTEVLDSTETTRTVVIDYGDTTVEEAIDDLAFQEASTQPACSGAADPVVDITSHYDNQLVATSSINVEGTVKDPAGAVVTFKINGAFTPLSPRSGNAGGPPTYAFYKSMPLISGPNIITARATNYAGKFHADTVTVLYGPPDTISIANFHVTQRGIMQDQVCDCDTPLVAGKFTIVRLKLDVRTATGTPTYVSFLEMGLYRRDSGQDVLVDTFAGEIYSGQTSMNIGYNSPSQLAGIHFWIPASKVDTAGEYTMKFQAWVGGGKVGPELQIPCTSKYLTFNETNPVKVFLVSAELPLFDPQLGSEHSTALITQLNEVTRTYPIRDGISSLWGSSNSGIKLATGDPVMFCDGVSTSSSWCKGTGFEWTFKDKNPAGLWNSDHTQVTGSTASACDPNNFNLGGRLLSTLPFKNLPASPTGIFRGGAHPGDGSKYAFPFDDNHDNTIDWHDLVHYAAEFYDSIGDAAHPATNKWSTDFENLYNLGETFRQFRDLNNNLCYDEQSEKSTVAPYVNLWYNVAGMLLPLTSQALDKYNKQNPKNKFDYGYMAFPVKFFPYNREFGTYGPGSSNGNVAWIRVEPDSVIAHELGHNVGDFEDLYHAKWDKTGLPITDQDRQVPAWAAYASTSQIAVSSKSPLYEIMHNTAGPNRAFFNTTNYKALYDKLKFSSSAAVAGARAMDTANPTAFQLSATIDPSGRLDSVSAQILATDSYSIPDPRGDYRLILGYGRTVLYEHRIALEKNHPIDNGDGAELYPPDRFNVTVPLPTPVFSWYEVRHAESVLLRVDRTANAPTVRLTAPNGGEHFSSTQRVGIRWEAADGDRDSLVYTVFYSPDNGQRWHVISTGVTQTELAWYPSTAPGSNQGLIRVVASDGLNEGEDTSDGVFQVEGKAPVAAIVSPKPDQEFLQWQKIQLRSIAFDLDGQKLEGFWRLNGGVAVRQLEGILDPLAPGDYELTLQVDDPDGHSSTASVSFKVLADWDKDGVSDLYEEKWGFDPSDPYDSLNDADGDGVKNIDEAWAGTVPVNLLSTWFYFPQIADGISGNVRFQTTLIFANAGSDTDVQIDFFNSAGQPMALPLGGAPASSTHSYPLKAGASLSLQTGGVGNLQAGYARVTTGIDVDGTAVFSHTDSGVLWYEAGVPKTRGVTDFSLFMDSTGDSRETGLAMVNTGGETANATLRLYDKDFSLKETRTLAQLLSRGGLGAGEHFARYASEIFEQVRENRLQEGVITVESDQPLAAVTLRQNDDPHLAFPDDITSMCAFPVIKGRADRENPGSRESVFYFPQIADGVAYNLRMQTTLVLVNSGEEAPVRVEFFRQDGVPLKIRFASPRELETDVLETTLRRGQVYVAQTSGAGSVKVGYARVTTGTQVGGTAVFSCWDRSFRLFDAGVPAARELTEFTVVVSAGGNRDTGIALVNTGSKAANATLRLYNKAFQLVASKSIKDLLGSGLAFQPGYQLAKYASEIFAQVRDGTVQEGIITVESDQPLAAVTLRQHNATRPFPLDFYLLTAFPVVPGRAK